MRFRLAVLLTAGATACGSFGSTDATPVAPPADAADASAPVLDAGGTDSAPASPLDVVKSAIHAPTSLFARSGSLFFTDGTKDVSVCEADACAPKVLLSGPAVKAEVAASAMGILAIDTTCGNAIRSDGLYLFGPTGDAEVTLGDPCPTSVAGSGDSAYFASAGLQTLGTSWSVQRCTATACEVIAGDGKSSSFGVPKAIAVTATDVYAGTSSGRIMRWANQPTAAASTQLLAGEFFTHLVTNGDSLFWLDGKRVRACSIADCSGTVITVAQDATARRLAADASGVYWTSAGSGGADGKVLHVARGASTVTSISTGQIEPDGIALDSGFVYWTTHGCDGCAPDQGAILRRRVP